MKKGLGDMMSVDEFATQVKMGVRIKCKNVIERIECVEILDELGFDATRMLEILKWELSKRSDYLLVGVSDNRVDCWRKTSSSIIPFSEVPVGISSNNEEFCDALKELLFA